jgi:hypothetical protein
MAYSKGRIVICIYIYIYIGNTTQQDATHRTKISKAKLKSSGDKTSPCFRPFWIRKLSNKCLPIRTLVYV